MSAPKARVLVIGAGPAGLAASVRLLEEAGSRIDLRLVHQGHHLGGKAASYRDVRGHLVEHGWHMVVGFYDRMRRLMRRAGVEPDDVLSSIGNESLVLESRTGRLHKLASRDVTLSDPPVPLRDGVNLVRFLKFADRLCRSGADLRQYDDVCIRTFAVQHGLYPHTVHYSVLRVFQELYFNFPESISAYHLLQTLKLGPPGPRSSFSVCRGGYSEQIWGPVGTYIEKLGGRIEPYTLATDWIYDGRRITGVRVGRPDSRGHNEGLSSWKPKRIPLQEGSARVEQDFDWVISTIPVAVLKKMNADDARMWESPYFSRLRNLRSGATVSMTVVTQKPMLGTHRGTVFGLPAPLGIVTNMKHHWNEYRDDPSVGAVLNFVGQEAGFESWTDEQIQRLTFESMARVPGLGDPREAGILYSDIHRNKSDFERILLCEPGVQPFRPGNRTPFENWFVAGDWVENEVDLVCMEGAITSGENAANEVLQRLEGA